MRLSTKPEDGSVVLGRIQAGRLFVMLDRGDYWQCAFVIPKGGFADLRRRGLPAFRHAIVELNPALASRVQEIASWDDVKLLTVRVDRLKRWYKPRVLCIGDAVGHRRHEHVGGLHRLDQLFPGKWLVFKIEPSIEQLAQAGFHHLRQLARDNN